MAKAGRWLAAEHPEITEPGQWTRSTCAAWVAAIDRMTVGDYVQRRDTSPGAPEPDRPAHQGPHPDGHPHLLPRLPGMGVDPRRFDPTRALALPRSIAALIGTDPRMIADDVWAKLLWAGLNFKPRPARQLRRHLLPDATDPRAHPHLAVQRPAQRRDLPAAGRLRPLAARRTPHPRRLHGGPRRRRRLPARRPRPQDRHRVHQARRPAPRPGHRGLAGRCAPNSPRIWTARPASRSTCCSPSAPTRSPRTTSTARSSRRSAPRPVSRPATSAATSPATGPAPRSPASSTTPRNR